MLMLILLTLTLMQGHLLLLGCVDTSISYEETTHNGLAKAKNQHGIIWTTKQAMSIKLVTITTVGLFFLHVHDFEHV